METNLDLKHYVFKVFIILGTILLLITGVCLSRIFLGKNNEVEEAIDKKADQMIEIELKLPPDSVHVDLGKVYQYADNS